MHGWRVRQSYIDKAARKKAELESERNRLNPLLVSAQQKEKDLKAALERAETRETKVSKHGEKVADKAREKINEYKAALTGLRDEIEYWSGRVNTLEQILEDLKVNHNQNYHDMAVKTAISGWDELKNEKLPEWQLTEEQLDNLEKAEIDLGDDDVDFANEFEDTVSLRIAALLVGLTLVYRIQDYFPAQVTDFVKEKIAYLRAVLVEQGFVADNKPGDGPKISRGLQKARDVHSAAVQEVSRFENQIQGVSDQLSSDYGPDSIFLAIKDDCFSVDTGEYTYTVCIMGQVTQKSNKDGTNTNLGYPLLSSMPFTLRTFPLLSPLWVCSRSDCSKFSSFDNNYTTMIYEHGLRCWNGPERSAKVELECGAENEVIKVSEPSKCEYVIKMKSPAACTNPAHGKITEKDEL